MFTRQLYPELLACSPGAPHGGSSIDNFTAAVLVSTTASVVYTDIFLPDCRSCVWAGGRATFTCVVASEPAEYSVATVTFCSNDPVTGVDADVDEKFTICSASPLVMHVGTCPAIGALVYARVVHTIRSLLDYMSNGRFRHQMFQADDGPILSRMYQM